MPIARPTDLLTTRSDPRMGSLLVIFSMATLSGVTACAKALALAGVHPFEIVFFRNLFAALVFSPLIYFRGPGLFDTGQLPMYGWRCSIMLASMLLWFYSLSQIPIGEVTAITFLTPLFGTLGAIIFLGEKVRARRWTALAIGFIGALIILRPGLTPLGWGQLAALLSTITGGFGAILVKQLTQRDDPNKIVFLTHLFLAPMSLVPALFVWHWPPLSVVPLFIAMGACATLGHATLVRGYSMMDASLGLTFEFAKLPFATIIAYLFFAEMPDGWSWVGAAVIIGSSAYIARREASVRAEARAEQIVATAVASADAALTPFEPFEPRALTRAVAPVVDAEPADRADVVALSEASAQRPPP